MIKRYMIVMLAVSFFVAWVVPNANARLPRRIYRSIENMHNCNEPPNDPCFGSTSVTDQLYGAIQDDDDVWWATCTMTGLVFCSMEVSNDCPVVQDSTQLGELDFVETVDFVGGSASNTTALDPLVGQAICEENFPDLDPTFYKFWPVPAFVALSTYIFSDKDPLEIEELCFKPSAPDANEDLIAQCQSFTGKLPCCGDDTTLTVHVNPPESGTVNSNDPKIDNCTADCIADFDGQDTLTGDKCPEITLTAVESTGEGIRSTFLGWSGGGCSNTGDCTTTPTAEVTANFGATEFLLTVHTSGNINKGLIYIWSPDNRNIPFTDGDVAKKGECEGDCSVWLEAGTTVVLKVKFGNATWTETSDCMGDPLDPNSIYTCPILMDAPHDATAVFE